MMQDSQDVRKPDECLVRLRAPIYRGGTLIAEDVVDLDTHQRRIADPDGYRPEMCPKCGHNVLHVHDHPTRTPKGFATPIPIIRHRCANQKCRATWRSLPAFLARHLHHPWRTIEHAVDKDKPVAELGIPATTVKRWRSRIACAAIQLVVLLASSGGRLLECIAKTVGLASTRTEFVNAYVDLVKPVPGQRLGRSQGSSTVSSEAFVSCESRDLPRARGTARRCLSIPPFLAYDLTNLFRQPNVAPHWMR